MTNSEKPGFIISPELIKGSPFRHSIILPKESGRFELTGLAIPLGWQEAKIVSIGCSRTEDFLKTLLKANFLNNSGRVVVDSKTGLLMSVIVDTNPPSFLRLSDSPEGITQGKYESIFFDLKATIVVQHLASMILDSIRGATGDRRSLAYVDGAPGSYGPVNLEVPRSFLRSTQENPATTLQYQKDFVQQAREITEKFGLTLASCEFNEAGLLTYFEVIPGSNGTYYILSGGIYGEHNVDTPEQAIALQIIGVTFVNDLLEKLGNSISDRRV